MNVVRGVWSPYKKCSELTSIYTWTRRYNFTYFSKICGIKTTLCDTCKYSNRCSPEKNVIIDYNIYTYKIPITSQKFTFHACTGYFGSMSSKSTVQQIEWMAHTCGLLILLH